MSNPFDLLGVAYADGSVSADQFADALSRMKRVSYTVSLPVPAGPLPTSFDLDKSFIRYWKCHYCGSAVSNSNLKCPSCGGERR